MDRITFDNLKGIKEKLDKEKLSGFSEIIVIQSALVRDGTPILMLSENDYKEFTKHNPSLLTTASPK